MMFLLIMILLTLKCSNTFTNSDKYMLQKKIIVHNNSGYDERFPNITNDYNIEQVLKIKQYFEKKKLLKILQDENVSIITKIAYLKDNSITPNNIVSGGLLKDFDFEDF